MELQEKKKVVTVGIMGVQSGAGVTTLAVSLAGYLSGCLKIKTAVAECGQNSDFALMKAIDDAGHFTLKHIDYYGKNAISVSAIDQLNCHMAVIDFGCGLARMGDFLQCTHKIVVGTLEPWNVNRYISFCDNLIEYSGSDSWLHILHGDISEIRKIARTYGLCAVKRPFIDNVHIIDRELLQFFQTLF